jgi:hypothetical protein
MDAISSAAVLSALAGSATTIATVWLRARGQRLQARDEPRRSQLCDLPPGSRIVDFGRHGTVIDIGGQASGTENG